jgi:hypothetical protein
MEEVHIMGTVRNGKFFPVDKQNSIEVNETGLVDAVKTVPLDLGKDEGKVIMIGGQIHAGAIWEAQIEDVASPILSAIVLKIFGGGGEFVGGRGTE